jgi:nitrite reductase (NADH) small subunit
VVVVTSAVGVAETTTWHDVCDASDLEVDRGVCALIEGHQVAIFSVSSCGGVLAVGNHDPFSRANVIARGIVGTAGERPVVASPVYKQRFDLRTGACLDDAGVSIPVYPVRIVGGRVEVALP